MAPEQNHPDLEGTCGWDTIHPEWAAVMREQAPTVSKLRDFLAAEAIAGTAILPPPHRIMRAFAVPLSSVRVLIIGQDPYPTPGHAVGWAFATSAHTQPLPRSLVNIYRELDADLGIAPASHGDLSAWVGQGVMLLNTCLTVAAGSAGSHRKQGWEELTSAAVAALAAHNPDLVAILWGQDAQALAPLMGSAHIISSPHPSPLSAHRGFFGSSPFSRTNALLSAPIDWSLTQSSPQQPLFT